MTYKNKIDLETVLDRFHGNKHKTSEYFGISDDTVAYWIKKFHIEPHDDWCNSNRSHYFNQHYFDEIDTSEKAYWLGFLMADCSIEESTYKLCVNQKFTDILHLEKLKNALSSDYQIITKSKYHKTKGFEYTTSTIRFSSKHMINILMTYGIVSRKTGSELIPENIIESDYVFDYIRGFFDGDGCISKNKKVCIGSASKQILEQINYVCESKLGISFTIYERKNYNVPFYMIDSSGSKRNKKFLDALYSNASVFLNRKYDLYKILFCPVLQQCST